MNDVMNKVQGMGLALLTKISSSELLDQLKLRKFVEKSVYQGSKNGFKALSKSQKILKNQSKKPKQRLQSQQKSLFDLNLSEEQQMMVDTLQPFARDVLYPLAAQADHDAIFPPQLWQSLQELGLKEYVLPEDFGGYAQEKNVITQILIAEYLARGDFSLTASLLSSIGVINALTTWGNTDAQNKYLSYFAEDTNFQATFAVQEATPAFDPNQLKTTAEKINEQYVICGEKTLVILGAHADLFLVTAMFDGQAQLFAVMADETILCRSTPAMGLKAAETVTLQFNHSPAQLITDQDFDYHEFLDMGNLVWGAMAIGTCEAIKAYCIQYANERTAFGEPISHRQSVAFMIADMAIEIDAMRMLILNAASLAETDQDFHREAYLARILCAEKAMQIATNGVQILGGHGYTKEHPVERWYRDLRAVSVLHSGLHA